MTAPIFIAPCASIDSDALIISPTVKELTALAKALSASFLLAPNPITTPSYVIQSIPQ